MYAQQSKWTRSELPLLEENDDVLDVLTLPEVRQYAAHDAGDGELGLYRLLERPDRISERLLRVDGRRRKKGQRGDEAVGSRPPVPGGRPHRAVQRQVA